MAEQMDAEQQDLAIWIIEDIEDYRENLRFSLEDQAGLNCSGAFATYEAARKELRSCDMDAHPDIILLDIQLPGKSGIEAIPLLKESIPNAEIVILTTFDDKRKVFDAICAGASGYLLKTEPIEEIAKGIRDVFNGGSPLSSGVANIVLTMFTNMTPDPAQAHEDLKDIELEILRQLADGRIIKEIAETMGLKFYQVNYHIRCIYTKLQTNTQSGAVAKAIRQGII